MAAVRQLCGFILSYAIKEKIGRSIRERKARLHQAKRDLWYFLLDREIFLWYNSKDSPR